jgi:hypothetical protein
MSNTTHQSRWTLPLAGLVATVAAVLALTLAGGHGADAHSGDTHATENAGTTVKEAAFHDGMRKLWEDHITWTRLFIVSAAADLPDLKATTARLLRNQDDIGDAIKPYYGRKAGNGLTALLKQHILGAADILTAAKAGDEDGVKRATAAWYRNGNQIADFLHGANPDEWPRGEMRKMMRAHLDLTLTEAVAHLQADHRTDIRTYDRIHRQILHMADMLSDGIMAQFPKRF